MRITLKSARATKKFAARLARKIAKSKAGKHAQVVGLVGDLGSGKTTFVQGFIKALGVKVRITSPTFLIFRPYPLPRRIKNFRLAYHVDLYRIKSAKELTPLHFKEILADPRHLVLVEWAEKIRKSLPKNTLWINFEHGQKFSERIIYYQDDYNSHPE